MVNEPMPCCRLGVYFLESAFPAVTVLTSIRTHGPYLSVFLFIPLHACYFFLLSLYIFDR